ncbi:MAG: HupE/UreJ family protein [Sphingomonadaceae bacterium]|nr:HupE/UreJ family protein [Sphingomonadaceae bacterium]
MTLARRIARSVLAALLALLTSAASAHLMPNSVISLDFDRHAVQAEILMPMSELAYGSGHRLSLNAASGLGAERPFVTRYVLDHLAVRGPDGRPWSVAIRSMTIASDSWNTDIGTTVVLTPPPGASARRFTLAWSGIIDRVANHFVLVFARSDFATGTLASAPEMIGGLQGATRTIAIDRGQGSAWRGFAASLRLGMEHIAEGHDHLLFLIALLLPAPLLPAGRRWGSYGGARRTIRRLALIVSAFTLGHSITLIGGAFLGWQLPQRPVEVGIALSILLSALHAWRPIFRGREPLIAAGFGLVHGLAFATVIGNFRLEPLAKAQSILGFNLGIELVQLLVVAAVLPLLLMLAPMRIYAPFRSAGAAFAGFAALAWIEERITGLPNGVGDAVDALLGKAPWLVLAATLVLLLHRWLRIGGVQPRAASARLAGLCVLAAGAFANLMAATLAGPMPG